MLIGGIFQFVVRVWRKLRREAAQLGGLFVLSANGVQYGKRLILHGIPIVSLAPDSSIRIGDGVVLSSRSVAVGLGVNHPVVLRTLAQKAEIVIGDNVRMSGVSICSMTRIVIGADAMIGANAMITDSDFHPIDPAARRSYEGIQCSDVIIGRNVFIGAHAMILKGVTIGENSVIGAGSVVSSSIAANMIAAGNPCRPLKPLPSSKEPSAISQ